jgi:aminoglycoside/choline kinase family phosphotransferase
VENINNISTPKSNSNNDLAKITSLFCKFYGANPDRILPLAGAGSNRRYYRIDMGSNKEISSEFSNINCPVIATCGDDPKENQAFISLSRHFANTCKLPVPEVLTVSADNLVYLQTYGGNESIFDKLSNARNTGNYTAEDTALLEQAMRTLAQLQYCGGHHLNYDVCYPRTEMDSRLVNWDLNYFKYCFLKPSGLEFDENRLQDEFDILASHLLRDQDKWTTFMHRDFQSRNVMINADDQLTIIDFQGGRRGPAAYDVASFLWQAKAKYPESLKAHLIDVYINAVEDISNEEIKDDFKEQLTYFVLFRTLQTLGAYGFRGWIERKPHFLQSVPLGVDNFAALFANANLKEQFPVLNQLAIMLQSKLGSNAQHDQEAPYIHAIAASDNPLTVSVTSFSFKKGIPEDPSGNGGGFVFDCRAPHNPGRYEPYKKLTGLDKPVRDFLERDGEIFPFIEECKRLVDASVERYLQRNFTNLSINFGCTGGQHRSVYSADAVARHLNDKYGVRVELLHREQGISELLPAKDVTIKFDSFLRDPQKPYNPASL